MAIKPEFINLLRDIRDRIYPTMVRMYDEVLIKYDIIVQLMGDLARVTVKEPVDIVPIQENGDPGLPYVLFDETTAQFTFGIPAGSKGQDLAITLTFNTLAEMYAYVDPTTLAIPEAGTVVFNDEDSKVYIKLDTGTNTGATDWSTGTLVTPTTAFQDLTDTPADRTGKANYILKVNATEDAITYVEEDLTQQIANTADILQLQTDLSTVTASNIGDIVMSSNATLQPGWELWNEDTILGALVADYGDLIASSSVLVSNVTAVTFDFKGHGGRYIRPAGTDVTAGDTLEDEFKSHEHSYSKFEYNQDVNGARVEFSNVNINMYSSDTTGLTGGTETRPKTIGLYMKIYVGEL